MKKELIKLYKQYLKYIDKANADAIYEGRPIPANGKCYSPSFIDFMEWLKISDKKK